MKPSGWKREPLTAFCAAKDDIRCGPFGTQLNKSEFREEGVPLWGIKQVNRHFRIRTKEFLEEETAERLSNYDLRPGDLVMTRKGTVGNCAVYPETFEPGIMHSDLLRIRIDPKRCDPRFLVHQLHHSNDVARQLSLISGGAIMPGINVGRLKELEVVVPPLPEQKRIAAILDKADGIRRKRQQALRLTDDFLRSVFLDMFGDPVTNPMGWATKRIDQVCRLVRGSSPRPQGDPRYFGGPVPRLMVADITRDGFLVTPTIDSLTEEGATKSRPVPSGTVVMAVSGDVGVVSKLAIPACIHDGFVGFLDLDHNDFQTDFFLLLLHYLKSTHAKRKAGAIFQNLTTTDIKAMEVPVPPQELQLKFDGVAARSTEFRNRLSDATSETVDLFASLQQRAFQGEL